LVVMRPKRLCMFCIWMGSFQVMSGEAGWKRGDWSTVTVDPRCAVVHSYLSGSDETEEQKSEVDRREKKGGGMTHGLAPMCFSLSCGSLLPSILRGVDPLYHSVGVSHSAQWTLTPLMSTVSH
jgi:hypothetical protein